MEKLFTLGLLGLSSFLGFPSSIHAQAPALINYQGRLLNGTNLVNGSVGLSLRLFNVPSGGASIYEDSNTVTVADGLYSTFIGDNSVSGSLTNALLETNVWIEVGVNGVALTPRERLVSVAYALRAGDSVMLGGLAAGSFATGSPVYVESDPAWAGVSNSLQTQLVSLASASVSNTVAVTQLQANVSALAGQVSALPQIRAGVTNMAEFGPTRFSVAFNPPFAGAPVVTLTPQLPDADAHVLSVSPTGFVGVASSTGYTVQASVISHFRDEGRLSAFAEINNNPAIAYHDTTSNLLMFVRANNGVGFQGPSVWSTPTVVDQVNVGSMRFWMLQVNGRAAIVYRDSVAEQVKFVRALNSAGTAWGSPVVLDSTDFAGGAMSLAIANGRPAVAYTKGPVGNAVLKFVRALDSDGASWGAPVTVDPVTGNVAACSMVIVSSNPAVAYYYSTSNDLRFVRALDADGVAWGAPLTVDSIGLTGLNPSLAIVSRHPAIAYYHSTSNDLRYVRAADTNGAVWPAPVTADSTGVVGSHPTLAQVKDHPAILYNADNASPSLKYVRGADTNGATWGTPTNIYLYSSGFGSPWPAALGVLSSTPVASFYETVDKGIRFLSASAAEGTSWFESFPVRVQYDGYAQMKMFNGRPCVIASSLNRGTRYMAFFRSLDSTGGSWSAPTIIATNPATQPWSSITLNEVAGNPAIVVSRYAGVGTNFLMFRRANDADGITWGSPVTAHSSTNDEVYQSATLAVIAGNPAIAYAGAAEDLYYLRAQNPTGSVWNAPVLVSASNAVYGAGSVGSSPALIDLGGLPLIAYGVYGTYSAPMLSLGSDASGSGWQEIYPSLEGNGSGNQMIQLGGRIARVTGAPAGLISYSRATDTTGTNWINTYVGETTNVLASSWSLAEVKGVAAMSFLRGDYLRYIEAKSGDAEGTMGWDRSILVGPINMDSQYSFAPFSSLVQTDDQKAFILSRTLAGLTAMRLLPHGVNVNWMAVGP